MLRSHFVWPVITHFESWLSLTYTTYLNIVTDHVHRFMATWRTKNAPCHTHKWFRNGLRIITAWGMKGFRCWLGLQFLQTSDQSGICARYEWARQTSPIHGGGPTLQHLQLRWNLCAKYHSTYLHAFIFDNYSLIKLLLNPPVMHKSTLDGTPIH